MAFTMPLILLISFVCVLTQSYSFVAGYPQEPHFLANPLHNSLPQLHPMNRFYGLHKVEEAHKHKVEKPHLKVLRPNRPLMRPFHPVTSGMEINHQPAYYGGIAPPPMVPPPVAPYQYVEPMYHTRPHLVPAYSHLLPPVITDNRDYMI